MLGPISDALCEAGVPHYAGQAAVITSCSPASYRFSICWRCGWCCVRCQWQQRGRRRDPHFASDERLPPPPPSPPCLGCCLQSLEICPTRSSCCGMCAERASKVCSLVPADARGLSCPSPQCDCREHRACLGWPLKAWFVLPWMPDFQEFLFVQSLVDAFKPGGQELAAWAQVCRCLPACLAEGSLMACWHHARSGIKLAWGVG